MSACSSDPGTHDANLITISNEHAHLFDLLKLLDDRLTNTPTDAAMIAKAL